MEAKARKILEDALWRRTHKDYRSTDHVGREDRAVLALGPAGTCSVVVARMSDAELIAKLTPYAKPAAGDAEIMVAAAKGASLEERAANAFVRASKERRSPEARWILVKFFGAKACPDYT